MSEINACPFCGRDGETFDWYPLGKPITQYGCGPCNFWTNNLDTWNRRAAPPTRPDVGDALKLAKATILGMCDEFCINRPFAAIDALDAALLVPQSSEKEDQVIAAKQQGESSAN